jgi:rubrerythrin
MAVNEANHGRELAKRRSALFGNSPREVDRSLIFEVEAPDYNRTRAFMSMQEALELALDAEVKAYNYFDKALPEIKNADVRKLFAELLQEEIEHMDLVKKVMASVPQDPDFDPADFVDSPVGE